MTASWHWQGDAGSIPPACIFFLHGLCLCASHPKGVFFHWKKGYTAEDPVPYKSIHIYTCIYRLALHCVQGADHPFTEGCPRKYLRRVEDRTEL